MNDDASTTSTPDQSTGAAAQVRSQAVWAAIAALIMLYFGYSYTLVDDSFSARLLVFTLRYGGLAMALSAVLLATGWCAALMLDGVFAMIIGVGLALAGVMWIATLRTVSLNAILEIIFGYFFFTSGLRNFRDFCKLGESPSTEAGVAAVTTEVATAAPTQHAAQVGPLQREQQPEPPQRDEAAAPPPEGYLSSFADDDSEDRRPG